MDELDVRILEKLIENARKSYQEIARELNISLTIVSSRINKLEDENITYYVDWGDWTNTGWIGPYDSGQEQTVNHLGTKREPISSK
jgi:predicted DNA-binding transcriptional regulator